MTPEPDSGSKGEKKKENGAPPTLEWSSPPTGPFNEIAGMPPVTVLLPSPKEEEPR